MPQTKQTRPAVIGDSLGLEATLWRTGQVANKSSICNDFTILNPQRKSYGWLSEHSKVYHEFNVATEGMAGFGLLMPFISTFPYGASQLKSLF